MGVNSTDHYGTGGYNKGSVIERAEHSAVGDVATGRRFKAVQEVPNKVLIDEVSSSVTYIGETKPGTSEASALWRIKKIEVTGTVTKTLFADGDDNFDNVWSDRATLTYS